MPYKSKAQQAYFNANRDKLEAQGVDVDEWNKSSKGKKLPERVGKKKKKSSTESLIDDIATIITEDPDIFIEYNSSMTSSMSMSGQNVMDQPLQAADVNKEVREIQQKAGDEDLNDNDKEQEKQEEQERQQRQKMLEPQFDAMTKNIGDIRNNLGQSTGQIDTGMGTMNKMNTNIDNLDDTIRQFERLALQ